MKYARPLGPGCAALFLTAALAWGAGPTPGEAPYVGAREADTLFAAVTPQQMEVLRGKRILFLSRSFGLNLCNGLNRLRQEDPTYDLLGAYARYDLFKAGGNLAAVPPAAFATNRFVHVMATYWPHTVRLRELDALIRQPPHAFREQIDVAIVFFHYADDGVFEPYARTLDALRRDFPKITFVYVTAGFMDKNHVAENTKSARFGEQVRQRYRGKVPLYDLGAILSNDGAAGNAYDPSYSTDPAGVHPNTPFAEKRMARGMLVLLSQVFAAEAVGKAAPAPAATRLPVRTPARAPAAPPPAAAQPATVTATSARWAFEGSLENSVAGGPPGAWQGMPAYGEGVAGVGLRLDGSTTGAYATVAHAACLDGMDALTLGVWARKDGAAGGTLAKKHVVYELAVGARDVRGYIFTGPAVADQLRVAANVAGLDDGAWHHYAMTFDGSNLLAYVDGREVARSVRRGRVSSQPARPLYIGRDPFGQARCFSGWLDDLRLLPHALPAAELAAGVTRGRAALSDRAAVRAILDANGLTNRQVSASAVFDDERVTRLYLQECGLRRITADIGRLDQLRLLHAYGDRTLGYPLLAEVAPELGACARLEELLLNQNALAALPEALSGLTQLRALSLGENRLPELSPALAAWATRFDPHWRATQTAK